MHYCAILDIGKTNKKCLVFDEAYRLVHESAVRLPETKDEDGDACEDLALLSEWVTETAHRLIAANEFDLRAINVAAYGASLVHLDVEGKPIAPLYNYLKPFPEDLSLRLLKEYGPAEKISLETASPWLGSLNSGLQLYRWKHQKPEVFRRIQLSVHLPQYLAYLIAQALEGEVISPASEICSIGCHTMLWDFQKNSYHDWVKREGLVEKFPPIGLANTPLQIAQVPNPPMLGIGLHDSSAALLPYLLSFREPFVLISTGTWCISLNPFNAEPLTPAELEWDCLCYKTPEGNPVKAARYFGGQEHEQAVKRIAKEYGVPEDFYRKPSVGVSFQDLQNAGDEYARFMQQLIENQVASTRLAIGGSGVRQIFVDGGFTENEMYMNLLARAFPEMEVYAAEIPQATALGAALVIHSAWNREPLPQNLISLRRYS